MIVFGFSVFLLPSWIKFRNLVELRWKRILLTIQIKKVCIGLTYCR